MKNWIIAALAAVGILGLHAGYYTPSINELAKSSVQIGNYCSGTAVIDYNLKDGRQDYVLTAKHCLDGGVKDVGKIIWVYTDKDGKHYGEKFIVYDVDPENDLALLQRLSTEDTWGVPPLPVGDGGTSFGDHGVTIGYPLGLTRSVSEVIFGDIITLPFFRDVSKDGYYQYATGMVSPGSSGSSVLKNGEIAGVLTGGAVVVLLGYQSFWVPQERVYDFVVNQGMETNALPEA